MIIANSYPTRTRGIIVKYIYFCFPTSSLGNTLIEENLQSTRCLYPASGSTIWSHPQWKTACYEKAKYKQDGLIFILFLLSAASVYTRQDLFARGACGRHGKTTAKQRDPGGGSICCFAARSVTLLRA